MFTPSISLVLLIIVAISYQVNTSQALVDESSVKTIPADGRRSKTIGLLRNMLSKPRVSPLYLLDGTICRFVNFQPICTTLSTTGINRGGASGGGNGGNRGGGGGSGSGGSGGGGSGGGGGNSGGGGGSSGGNRGPTSQGVSSGVGGGISGGSGVGGGNGGGGGVGGVGGQRPSSSEVMAGGSSVQFVSPQGQLRRPAALMDDDPQDLNVDATSNLTESSMINRDQQPALSTSPALATRPLNFIVSRRRPVNLLPFRRPAIIRPVQVVGRRRLAQQQASPSAATST